MTPAAYDRVGGDTEAFVVKLGNDQVLARPATRQVTGLNWQVGATFSDDDGLIVENPTLGARLLATKISIPYVRLKTSLFDRRFELFPNTTIAGTVRSQLIGYWVVSERYEGDRDRVVIEARYRLDGFPSPSQSYLFVTQRYEFHEEVNESTTPALACEPSEEDPRTGIFANFTCARWKPITSYEFVGRNGETLTQIDIPTRLHLTPDGDPLRSAAVIHDCEPRETGTTTEPCLFSETSPLSPNLLSVFAAPPNAPNPDVPGVRLAGNKVAVPTEGTYDAIINGAFRPWHNGDLSLTTNAQAGTWGNLHLSRNYFVDLPVPLPPGCPECVHIHWHWAAYFGTRFGDGAPQLDGPAGRAGYVMIPQRSFPSQQDVRVALVAQRSTEDDPTTATSLVNGETLTGGAGMTVWYLATGKDSADTFFAHGGFFSPLTGINPVDISATLTRFDQTTPRVNTNQRYYVTLRNNTSTVTPQPVFVAVQIPAATTFVTAYVDNGRPIADLCNYIASQRRVICDVASIPSTGAYVWVEVKPTSAVTYALEAQVATINRDTLLSNNRATLSTTVSP